MLHTIDVRPESPLGDLMTSPGIARARALNRTPDAVDWVDSIMRKMLYIADTATPEVKELGKRFDLAARRRLMPILMGWMREFRLEAFILCGHPGGAANLLSTTDRRIALAVEAFQQAAEEVGGPIRDQAGGITQNLPGILVGIFAQMRGHALAAATRD